MTLSTTDSNGFNGPELLSFFPSKNICYKNIEAET